MKIKKHTITHAIKYIFLSLLLALPFIAMLPSTFYYAFNQNAQDNTANEVNITYQYQTNEVNSIDDLIIGNIYSYKVYNDLTFIDCIGTWIQDNNIEFIEFTAYNFVLNNANWTDLDDYYTESEKITINTSIYQYENYIQQYIYKEIGKFGNDFIYIALMYDYHIDQKIIECDFVLTEELKTAIEYYMGSQSQIDNVNKLIKPSTYLGEKNIEIIDHNLNNQNAFYYASSQVFEKPLFNWVKNSIFVVPIMGMLGIFGISEMNFISSLLVYWVNILSIYAILNIILLVIEKLGSFGKRKNE